MDNTTQQENTQAPMDLNSLQATLAHATHLHEQILPQPQAQQGSQTPQNAPGQEMGNKDEKYPKDDITAEITKLGDELMQRMDKLEKEVKAPSDVQTEIQAIKDELDKLESNG